MLLRSWIIVVVFFLVQANSKESASLDFVDANLEDVARTLSAAYGTPILVDDGAKSRVTFHLDGLGLFEGLTALCEANGFSLVQVGGVFHIQKAKRRGESSISVGALGVSLSLKNADLREFVHDFSMNTGLNVLLAPGVEGTLNGDLQNLPPETAIRELMAAHGFQVRGGRGCLRVILMPKENVKLPNVSLSYANGSYSADFRSAPLMDVLRTIADYAKLNLAVYGELQERVQLSFRDVSLEDLVAAVFRGSRYTYRLDSLNLYVSEGGAKKALSNVELYPLKFISPEKAAAQLAKFMASSSFAISEYREQNALLLGGSAVELAEARSILQRIDLPLMQVTLSCVVVELKKGKNFAMGIRSGSAKNVGEYDVGVRGFFDFLGKDVSKSGAFGKIGILPDRFELELSSMEENNEAEVLARPRLTTLNGSKAELNVTNTVYYLVSQVSADGYPITDYRSFNDGVSLELTPTVTQNGKITLEVSPEIKTAGRSSGDGPRDISTRNLKTTVVLQDGETFCLGGLIRKNKSEVRSAVPFFGSIPLLGRLFSYTSIEEENNELMIFITPTILK